MFQLKRFRWLLALALVVATLWLARAPLLSGFAHWWIVDMPLSKADAIFVIGGGEQTRPERAADLYHQGYAPRILIARPEKRKTDKLGLTPTGDEVAHRILLLAKVPEDAIEFLPEEVTSTRDEASALKTWSQRHPKATVIVPTDAMHTRRAAWIFQRIAASSDLHILIHSIPPEKFSPENWWQHEDGLITSQNEVLKMLFYLVKF